MKPEKPKLKMGVKLLLAALLTVLALRWVPTDDPWVQSHVVEGAVQSISNQLPHPPTSNTVIVGLAADTQSNCPWLVETLKTQSLKHEGLESEKIPLSIGSLKDAHIQAHCTPSTSWGSMDIVLEGNPQVPAWKGLKATQSVPSWVALVAPVLAVVWAFLLGNALLALFLGIVVGSSILVGFAPIASIQMAATEQIGATLISPTTLKILLFTSSLIGLVQVCVKSGGIEAFIHWLTRGKLSRRRTQGTTVALGTMIFFDDYANTMVVGASMQPMSDKMKISREKLAYLVDATSAPIAGIAMISTWIGMEINLFESFGEQRLAEFFGSDVTNGFSAFRVTMPFRFYCILTLLFVVMLVWSRRDFGPMLKAELQAQNAESSEDGEKQDVDPRKYARPIDGFLPILVTLVGIVTAFLYFAQDSWDAASDQMLNILPICGLSGGVFALTWTHFRTGLKLPQAMKAYALGIRTVAPTLAILVLAMTIQGLTDQLGTGVYLAGLVHDAPPALLPAAVFLLSGAVAFSTGSSWATMGLLVPVAVPIAHAMVETHNMSPALTLAVAGSVLDGAIFGDHCSPISDTTVMSSAATGCDHIRHVRTQVPYALTVMLVAGIVGYGFSTLVLESPWPGYGLGALVLFGVIRVFGKKSDIS